jgi:hypothetical protein
LIDKKTLFEACKNMLLQRIADGEKAMLDAQEAANSEEKSSMGDKYETGRAMAQNDRAMLENQKNELLKDIANFENINFEQKTEFVKSGSLVHTTIGYILLSVSLGKILDDGEHVMLISSASPLGTELTGKKVKESVTINGRPIQILGIY